MAEKLTHLCVFIRSCGERAANLVVVLKEPGLDGFTTEALMCFEQIFQSHEARWATSNNCNLHLCDFRAFV